jgi:hypothetical protein
MFLCERIVLRRSDFGVGMVWPWYTHCLGAPRQNIGPSPYWAGKRNIR